MFSYVHNERRSKTGSCYCSCFIFPFLFLSMHFCMCKNNKKRFKRERNPLKNRNIPHSSYIIQSSTGATTYSDKNSNEMNLIEPSAFVCSQEKHSFYLPMKRHATAPLCEPIRDIMILRWGTDQSWSFSPVES